MKEEKKEDVKTEITKYLFWLLIILALFGIFFNGLEKNCKDESCFNDLFSQCKKANLRLENDGHLFLYRVIGNNMKDFCTVSIKLEKLNETSNPSLKEKFSGKEMTCNIPYEFLDTVKVTEEQKILDYCHGPLKEAMLEFMIEKLYGSIAQNFGGILAQLEKWLFLSSENRKIYKYCWFWIINWFKLKLDLQTNRGCVDKSIKFRSYIRSGNYFIDEIKAIYKLSTSESALIVLHGFTMSKESMLYVGNFLNEIGIASLIMDLPYHGILKIMKYI